MSEISSPDPPVQLLPLGTASLARELPPAPVGTLFALGRFGGIRVAPTSGTTVLFGRNEPDVHVCVGPDDLGVSRRHGAFSHDGDRWLLHNLGRRPLRLPGSQLVLTGESRPLPTAYTPIFIRTAPGRQHLLETRVGGQDTARPERWQLSPREHLVLVVLGQRYLRHEAFPQPLTWDTVAAELDELQPGEGWTAEEAARAVAGVRERRPRSGAGTGPDHDLIVELLRSASIVPRDLDLLA
ncbi:FHA domain-containing protein [Pseudonocardia sp. CA-107938]|uniref:FHA domain-containing protein n=1 Tax=Pseudonocardia sp. CA-107938 TaxID=3240021 RepID=UPI003D93420C